MRILVKILSNYFEYALTIISVSHGNIKAIYHHSYINKSQFYLIKNVTCAITPSIYRQITNLINRANNSSFSTILTCTNESIAVKSFFAIKFFEVILYSSIHSFVVHLYLTISIRNCANCQFFSACSQTSGLGI